MPEAAQDRLLAEPILFRALFIDILFTTVMSLLFLLGGGSRVSAASFAFVRTTGGQYVWGSLLLIGVAALVIASRGTVRHLRVGILASALVHALFGGCFLLAALADARVSYLGAALFLWNAARLMNQYQGLAPRRAS